MNHRIVSLRHETARTWFGSVLVCMLVTAGPIVISGILTLLWVDADGKLAEAATLARKYSGFGVIAGAAGILPPISSQLFYDDFGDGLRGVFKGFAFTALATVAAPFAAVLISIWVLVLAHHDFTPVAVRATRAASNLAMFAAAGEAIFLGSAWLLGRLLRR